MSASEPFAPATGSFLGLEGPEAARDFARFILLPAAYDGTQLEAGGTRHGPEAILRASRLLEPFDEELTMEPWRMGIHTLPVMLPGGGGPEAMHERVKRMARGIFSQGKVPVLVGGERTLTAPAIEACLEAAAPRLTVLQIDAHANLRETHQGSPLSHACTFRRLAERVHLVPVALRACSAEEHAVYARGTVKPHFMHTVRRRNFSDSLAEITETVRKHLYISIDLDGLDPSIMPATPQPEPGGLLWWELLALLRTVISRSTIVGFDVMNLAPIPGLEAPNLLAAQLIYKIIGYIEKYQAFWRPAGPSGDTSQMPTMPMDAPTVPMRPPM